MASRSMRRCQFLVGDYSGKVLPSVLYICATFCLPPRVCIRITFQDIKVCPHRTSSVTREDPDRYGSAQKNVKHLNEVQWPEARPGCIL
ncbi:hypothetical protein ABKN59_008978 [Abortiporus biennis]